MAEPYAVPGHPPKKSKPTGLDDPRTKILISFADITSITKRGFNDGIRITLLDGSSYEFSGGHLNSEFDEDLLPDLAKRMHAAAADVALTNDGLTSSPGSWIKEPVVTDEDRRPAWDHREPERTSLAVSLIIWLSVGVFVLLLAWDSLDPGRHLGP